MRDDALDIVAARKRIIDAKDVRIDLEAPDAAPHAVEEVRARAVRGDERRTSAPIDARQSLRIRRTRRRVVRIEEGGLCRHFRQVIGRHAPKGAEADRLAVTRIRGDPARECTEDLTRNRQREGLRRRVDEIEVMRAKPRVRVGDQHRIVLELRGDLRLRVAERVRHRRIQVRGRRVRRVELVDHPCLAAKGIFAVGEERFGAETQEEVAAPLAPATNPQRIACRRHAVDSGGCGRARMAAPWVVEQGLRHARRPHRVRQRVDVARDLFVRRPFGVMRLVHEFKAWNRRIFGIGHSAAMRIAMPDKLLQERRLHAPKPLVPDKRFVTILAVAVAETALVVASRAPMGHRRQHGDDPVRSTERNQVVELREMSARIDEMPLRIRDLAIEAVDAQTVEAEPAKMRHVHAHRLERVLSGAIESRTPIGKARVVVDSKKVRFPPAFIPQDALRIDRKRREA